jgi:hypothetical protein
MTLGVSSCARYATRATTPIVGPWQAHAKSRITTGKVISRVMARVMEIKLTMTLNPGAFGFKETEWIDA